MKFTTEQIEKLAQLVSEILFEVVGGAEVNIAKIEDMTRYGMKEAGRRGLGKFFSKVEGAQEKEILGEKGEIYTYHSKREAKIESVFGWVSYTRSYYTGEGKGKSPIDEKFGLEPGKVTSGLAKLLAMVGADLPFRESARVLEQFLLFEIADNTIRKETHRFGKLQDEIEEEQKERSKNIEYYRERKRRTKNPPKRLYGSIDGAHTRIEDVDEEEKWKEMKVGTWYEVEEVPPSQQSKRHRKKEEIGHQALRTKDKLYYCDMKESSKFSELFWSTGYEKQADLAKELVFVNNGAKWIWKLVEMHYPRATQILDWFHVEERVEKVAKEAFPDKEKRLTWSESTLTALWEGRTLYAINACAKLADDSKEAAQAETYFRNNKQRMKYAKYREITQGLFCKFDQAYLKNELT